MTMGLELPFTTLRSPVGTKLKTTAPFLPESSSSSQKKCSRKNVVVWMKVDPYVPIFENLVPS